MIAGLAPALQGQMKPVLARVIPVSAVAPEGLFRFYTSSEDDGDSDNDMGKLLDPSGAPLLPWDTGVDEDISLGMSVVGDKPPPPLLLSPSTPEQVVPRKRSGRSGYAIQSQEDIEEEEEEEEEVEMGEELRTATLMVIDVGCAPGEWTVWLIEADGNSYRDLCHSIHGHT